MFGYVPGGYARILDRLVDVLSERGVRMLAGHPVHSIRRTSSGDGPSAGSRLW